MSELKVPTTLHLHQGEKAVATMPQVDAPPATMAVVVEPPPPKSFGEVAGPYFTGGAALLAAAVALVGIAVGRRNLISQMRATVVSQNRQAWVNALRDDLAEFISEDYIIAEFVEADQETMDAGAYSNLDRRSDLAVERKRLLRRRIELRLNPGKAAHKELLDSIKGVSQATGRQHGRAVRDLTRKAQVLLRYEWLRVKAEAANTSPPPPLESLDYDAMFPQPKPHDAEPDPRAARGE